MIDYLRRYLNDPEEILEYAPVAASSSVTSENSLTTYLRRYLADPVS